MKNLTLIIPAKFESESLPFVLNEIKKYKFTKFIVLEKDDVKTIKAAKKFKTKIIYQKTKGYGSAILEGINKVRTKYLCVFNADGSFDPKYLGEMLKICSTEHKFVFGSRYIKKNYSEDDDIVTFVGNKFFSFLGFLLFKLKLSDILYTYVLGQTLHFKKLKLTSNDFRLCVEIPIKIKIKKFQYTQIASYERKRFAGKKKVNEIKDGFLILIYLLKTFFSKNED